MQDCFDIVFNSKTFMSVQIDLKKKKWSFFLIQQINSEGCVGGVKVLKNVLMPQFTWLIRVLDIGGRKKNNF